MIIVTKDEDFVTMRRLSSRAPKVVWVRIGNATSHALRMRMQPLMAEILAALAAGEEIIEVRTAAASDIAYPAGRMSSASGTLNAMSSPG
jgi:predicted nuclease of predicted toxin-antitoxin system